MLGWLVASAVVGAVAVRTRRSFAWDDAMSAMMLGSAGLMLIMCGSLLFEGRWLAALFTAPLAAALAVPAVLLARVPRRPDAKGQDDADDDEPGGGGGPPPDDPPPDPPGGGIDWDRFDEAREAWARSGSRTGV